MHNTKNNNAITSFVGIILSFKLRLSITNYIILFYFANIGLFSFFFILPRYSLSLLTIQIILSLFVLKNKTKFLKMKKILHYH